MNSENERLEALDWVLGKIAAAKKTKATASFPIPIIKPIEIPKPPALFSLPKTQKQKETELKGTKTTELDLWKKWKDGGHKPTDLDPLLKSMKPLIENRAKIFKNVVEIPTAAIDFEFKQQVVTALKKYDPSKGSALGTWVTGQLRKANRFIQTHQNFARLPESVSNKLGAYNVAKAELIDKLGHEPDDISLSEHSGIPLKTIKRINKEQRKALISTGIGDLSPSTQFSSREKEVIGLIYHQLSPQERVVHEYTFGLNNKPALKPGAIAKKLKMDNSKVSKLRTSIFKKMSPYLEE